MAHWQYLGHVEPVLPTPRTALATYVPPTLPDLPPRVISTFALIAATSVFVPVVVAAPAPIAWAQPLSEPVRVERRLLGETWAERPLEVPRSQHVTWYQPLSEPVRSPFRPLQYDTWAERPFEVPRSQHTTWYQPLSEPLRRPSTVPTIATGGEFVRAPAAAATPALSWYQPLSEPVGTTRRVATHETGAEVVRATPAPTPLGWWQPLSEPQFVRASIPQEFAAFVPRLAAVLVHGWQHPLAEPVRQRRHTLEPLTIEEPVQLWAPPPPVAFWYPDMPALVPWRVSTVALLVAPWSGPVGLVTPSAQLDICTTTTLSLMPRRTVDGLLPLRTTRSVMPRRTVVEHCEEDE